MSNSEIESILYGVGVDSWNRFQKFLDLSPQLKGKSYWYALKIGYESSDNLYNYSKEIKRSFLKQEEQREFLMDSKEIEYLNSLPEQFTIYRGMTEDELKSKTFGLSWTLKKEVASFFAFKYSRNYATDHLNKVVHEISINKSEVIAFFNNREEFEIIYIKEI